MSWDATLYSVTEVRTCRECGHELDPPREERGEIGWWNTTHNVAPMIYRALELAGIALADDESRNGMPGPESRGYLGAIITQLEADPEAYRAMNPPNGWGSYDGLLRVLREMRGAVADDEASVWDASG